MIEKYDYKHWPIAPDRVLPASACAINAIRIFRWDCQRCLAIKLRHEWHEVPSVYARPLQRQHGHVHFHAYVSCSLLSSNDNSDGIAGLSLCDKPWKYHSMPCP